MEELGLYVDNLRFVRQEDCDDGIGRPDCGIHSDVSENSEEPEDTFNVEVEEIIEKIADFLHDSFDLFSNLFNDWN